MFRGWFVPLSEILSIIVIDIMMETFISKIVQFVSETVGDGWPLKK